MNAIGAHPECAATVMSSGTKTNAHAAPVISSVKMSTDMPSTMKLASACVSLNVKLATHLTLISASAHQFASIALTTAMTTAMTAANATAVSTITVVAVIAFVSQTSAPVIHGGNSNADERYKS